MERLPILGFQREAWGREGGRGPVRLLGWEGGGLRGRRLSGRSTMSPGPVGSRRHTRTCVLGGENAGFCVSLPSSSPEGAPFHLVTR